MIDSLPRRTALLAVLLTMLAALLALPVAAHASSTQLSMFEDDGAMQADPTGALGIMRMLGVQMIRVPLRWSDVAPARLPKHFNAANPSARGYDWSYYDTIISDAARYGIAVDLDVTGDAPPWAVGPGAAKHYQWEPNAGAFGLFVKAVATRYSGHFTAPHTSGALPRVSFWSIWNEPDYGPSLAPQGLPGHLTIPHSPEMYRGLIDVAWRALAETGHGHDTIAFGELAPRGYDYWGVFSGMRPMVFLRSLYCLDGRYRPLRGTLARLEGCPTTAAGTRAFPRQHPALFNATGVTDHPYMRWYAPNHEQNPDPATHEPIVDYSTLGTMAAFERGLDHLVHAYGSHHRLLVYDTEFGYITTPPKHDNQLEPGHHRYPWVNQTTASEYLNWAEYIHWKDPRLASFMQYLLYDPLPATRSTDWGGYASGLIAYDRRPKATYYAWRLPLYMPVTTARRGSRLEVWGCIRPAHSALAEGLGPQSAEIQVGAGANPSNGAFHTVATVTVSDPKSCYFDIRIPFPGTGVETVRMQWNFPGSDPLGYFDPLASPGAPAYSRHIEIDLR
jgi:hypothetical protein